MAGTYVSVFRVMRTSSIRIASKDSISSSSLWKERRRQLNCVERPADATNASIVCSLGFGRLCIEGTGWVHLGWMHFCGKSIFCREMRFFLKLSKVTFWRMKPKMKT